MRTLLDNEGNAVRDLVFSAWGEIIEDTNPALDFPFAFTGREFDPETGLYYYRARYYSPTLGRFLSEDPLGFSAGDTNLSRYVGNGSTNAVDPRGLQEEDSAAGGAFDPYEAGLLDQPLLDHHATGRRNDVSIASLPRLADLAKLLREAADILRGQAEQRNGEDTMAKEQMAKHAVLAGIVCLWTREDMERWFEMEQNHRIGELQAARDRLLDALKRINDAIGTNTKMRTRVRNVLNGWTDTRGALKRLQGDLDENPELAQAMQDWAAAVRELTAIHAEAHQAAIDDYNKRHPDGPRLVAIEYDHQEGPRSQPKGSRLVFRDLDADSKPILDVTVVIKCQDGTLAAQAVDIQINRTLFRRILMTRFGLTLEEAQSLSGNHKLDRHTAFRMPLPQDQQAIRQKSKTEAESN